MPKVQTAGLWIIGAGILILLGKLGVVSFVLKVFWPLLPIAAGIWLRRRSLARRGGPLEPIAADMLWIYGVVFLFCAWFGWRFMAFLWPGFFLGIAVGLFDAYRLDGGRSRGVLLSAFVVGALSIVLFGITLLMGMGVYLIALLLIAVGGYLYLSRSRRGSGIF